MSNGIEIEAKFYVRDLNPIRRKLEALGAVLIQPRVLETNLRFDLPDQSLRLNGRVLRLRKDTENILTYKGPGHILDGIRAREELEVRVSDFDTAQAILEALGYQISMLYEKYRTTYELEKALVMLDEMPYGTFVEIEGGNTQHIFALAEILGLDKTTNCCESYQALFDRCRASIGFTFRDLTFANFQGVAVAPSAMGLTPAD
jgi:adenylate cyclase class 2